MKFIFNPCIYNSMSFVIIKKREIVWRITLVLMMINSYSYSTNDLVFIQFQIYYQDISRCLASTKEFWNTCRFKSSRVKIASSTRLESSLLDRIWIESTQRKSSTRRLQFVFRSCVKIGNVDMLKFTHTHTYTHTKVQYV